MNRAFILYSNFQNRNNSNYFINVIHLIYSIYQLKNIEPKYDIILYNVDHKDTYLKKDDILSFNNKLYNLGLKYVLNTTCRYSDNLYLDRILIPFNDYIKNNYEYVISLDNDLEFFNKKAILTKFFNLDVKYFSGVYYKNKRDIDCISAIINIMNIKNINDSLSIYDVDYYVQDYYNQCKYFNVSYNMLNNEEYIYARLYLDRDFSIDIKEVYGYIHHYYNDNGNNRKLKYIDEIILKNQVFLEYLKSVGLYDTIEFYRKSI